jgi:outer membrane lipoprotein-sorting protein
VEGSKLKTKYGWILLLLTGCGPASTTCVLAQEVPQSGAVITALAAPAPAPNPDKRLPTTEELLERFESLTGGHDVWSSFHSRMMKGLYQAEDSSALAGIEVLSKEPNKSFIKITLSNGTIVREVCDGKSAWLEDPRGRMREITGPALLNRIRHSNFNDRADTLLVAISGHVKGMEKIGTHTTYVVEFTPEKNMISKLYFDVESGLVVRADDVIHKDGADYKVETYMDDYRPVDGAYFPFRIRHVEKGNVFTVRITQVKNNTEIEDSIFQKPTPIRK